MVREFKIINEKGQEYSLMDIKNNCLLTDPDGLGCSYDTSYEQLNNTFVINLKKLNQNNIQGIANFINYDNYLNFTNFIETAEELIFSYKIPIAKGYKEFFRKVDFSSIGKTEKSPNGILSAPIIFNSLSLWYEKLQAIYKIEPVENEIRWDFIWDSRFTDYNNRSLTYINQGHIESPVEIEISGVVIKPKIELLIDGEVFQTINFNIQINEFEKLLYSSKEDDFYIKKQATDGELIDLYNRSVVNFIDEDIVLRIPRKKSCEIRLSAESDITNAKVTIYTFYKIV